MYFEFIRFLWCDNIMVMYKIANFIIKVRFLFTSMMYYLSKIMLLCVRLVNNVTWYLPSFNHNKKTLPINVPNIPVNHIITENAKGQAINVEPVLVNPWIQYNLNIIIEKQNFWLRFTQNFLNSTDNELKCFLANKILFKNESNNGNKLKLNKILIDNLDSNYVFNLTANNFFFGKNPKDVPLENIKLFSIYLQNQEISKRYFKLLREDTFNLVSLSEEQKKFFTGMNVIYRRWDRWSIDIESASIQKQFLK